MTVADQLRAKLRDLDRIDQAAYVAIAGTVTPRLDGPIRRLSTAANYSGLWAVISAGLAVAGGRPGRRAAVQAMTAIAVTSAVTNQLAKRAWQRGRPDREVAAVAAQRRVRMPESSSFPSGHAASAFAFATTVGSELPALALPVQLLAGVVAYSRVHTGVHYPGDVVVGALIGTATGVLIDTIADRSRRPNRG